MRPDKYTIVECVIIVCLGILWLVLLGAVTKAAYMYLATGHL